MRRIDVAAVLLGFVAVCAVADERIVDSPHNLSVTGPGRVRATIESRICIFCHVPHNASPAAPLWNRHNPTTYYRIYRSPTMDARVDQPGPASKQCLSCHDGSIAIGLTLDRPLTDPIHTTFMHMPTGPSNLTNDLSDDHPVGFRYDRTLSNRDSQLRPVELIDHRIPLGQRGEVECTACHDPHNNELGNFLRLPELEGALCKTCHEMRGWHTSVHAWSPRTVPAAATAGERLPYRSLRDNACRACHLSHAAPYRRHLLYDEPSRLCTNCHNGISARDIHPVLNQRSGHRIAPILGSQVSDLNRSRALRRVACSDCHNPHAVASNLPEGLTPTGTGVFVPPAMWEVPGVSIAGLPVATSVFYYEVCFKCHGLLPVPVRNRIIRQQDALGNVLRQFLPTTASAHPVAFPARQSAEVPSLTPNMRGRRLIGCQDCHNNPDATGVGGMGPAGPHGSRFDYLLVRRYETRDFTIESPQSYALCYECHDRTSILNNESFPWHREHVVRGRSPCSACHTAHGVNGSTTRHSHLINFDISIVGGQRLFIDTGRLSGSCTLRCHGVEHVNFTYAP